MPLLTEPIIHIDMDSFFVEVERTLNPGLRGRPVVVGGEGRRGVVASASYEARKFGVKSGISTGQARSLCDKLIVVTPHHSNYSKFSKHVFEIMRTYTPLVEAVSVDEAFLDVSGLSYQYPNSTTIAQKIREQIKADVGLPCSAGVASTRSLAKLASRDAKPDGVRVVPDNQVETFLGPKRVRDMWGVGEASARVLDKLGVETVEELSQVPLLTLKREFGNAMGEGLYALSHGTDSAKVIPEWIAKSSSISLTYPVDLVSAEHIRTALLDHVDQLTYRIRSEGLVGRTISLQIRYSDFSWVARSYTRPTYSTVAKDIYADVLMLLDKLLEPGRPVRLLGVGISGLVSADTPRQLDLEYEEDWDRLTESTDQLRQRFGSHVVKPARLLTDRPHWGTSESPAVFRSKL